MSGKTAFADGERARTDMLSRMAASVPGSELFFGTLANATTFDTLYQVYGIHPAMLNLMRSLGGDTRDTDVAEFFAAVCTALAREACTLEVVGRWCDWAVGYGDPSLCDQAQAGSLAPLVPFLTPVSRPDADAEVKQAATAVLEAASVEDQQLASILSHLFADLTAAPTSASDFAAARIAMLERNAMHEQGWSDADEQALMDKRQAFHESALGTVEPMTPENIERVHPLFRAALAALWEGDPAARAERDRWEQCRHAATLTRLTWIEEARTALIAAAKAVTPA